MPQHLGTGFEAMPVMNSFVWVAENKEKIVGILMAAPCHGLIFFVRFRIEETAPKIVAHLLFRHCIKDCLAMGFKGYFTYVDPAREMERQMIPICRKAGGLQLPEVQVGIVGSLEQARRF